MSFLLDTNVVSELRKPRPDRGVIDWLTRSGRDEVYLSVLTVGEITTGIERLRTRAPARVGELEEWLAELERGYSSRIVPVDVSVARTWGRLSVSRAIPPIDGLLAATAIVHGWTLVTRNVRDMEPTGVRLHNPFSATR